MSGLISSLHNSSGAIKVHSKGLEIVGKNLANINNRNYAKQRVEIGDRGQINTGIATESNGVEAMGLRQNRDALLDKSVMRELTATASLEATQKVLQNAETALGQFLDRTKDSTSIQNALRSGGGGISDALTDFFNAWESVSVKPGDIGEKQLLIEKAKILAEKINQTDERLEQVQLDVDEQVAVDVGEVNRILEEIGKINEYIAKAELVKPYSAVDLRDQRQAKLEELSKFVDITFSPIVPDGLGQISVKSGNVELINGKNVFGTFNYDAATRQFGFDFTPNVSSPVTQASLNNGQITEIKMPQVGGKDQVLNGYPSSPLPIVTVVGGSGSGAIVEPVVKNGLITSFAIKNGGSGYTNPITVTVSQPADIQYDSASPIASGKLRAQIESAEGSVQTARDEIAILADQLTKSVNFKYSTGLGDTRFFDAKAFDINTITAQTSDIKLQANHGLAVGDQIRLINLSNGGKQEGAGLNEGDTYFVKSVSGNTVQLSATLGGNAIPITSSITSASTFRRLGDPPIRFPIVTNETLRTSDKPGGGNQVALAVAALGTQSFSNLGTASFTTYFNKTVTTVAQQLSSTNIRLEDQKLSEQNAVNSRDQYSGVSQDEEITDMMKFQRSFQASARHINVLDTLLEQVVNRLGVG